MAADPAKAREIAAGMGGFPVAVKAQIHAGPEPKGRGKAGRSWMGWRPCQRHYRHESGHSPDRAGRQNGQAGAGGN
ncbi:MAG: hypothetical protein R2860_06040 [Desulfobacterales bacterium]